jgi:hypothetical protein
MTAWSSITPHEAVTTPEVYYWNTALAASRATETGLMAIAALISSLV